MIELKTKQKLNDQLNVNLSDENISEILDDENSHEKILKKKT